MAETLESTRETMTIRPLRVGDLETADRVMRTAFGTFLGAPDPQAVFGDTDYVATRFRAAPDCAWAAELDGEVVGSNFATRWGSFGFFGPLTVRPDLWDRGIAGRLMEPVMAAFASWGLRQSGLFTFPHSAKHLGLYQKHGFWPRFLNPVMSKPVEGGAADLSTYSALSDGEREAARKAIRALTDAVFPGLDLERELRAVHGQSLGDTVLLHEGGGLAGFAVCHCGAGTEAAPASSSSAPSGPGPRRRSASRRCSTPARRSLPAPEQPASPPASTPGGSTPIAACSHAVTAPISSAWPCARTPPTPTTTAPATTCSTTSARATPGRGRRRRAPGSASRGATSPCRRRAEGRA